MENNINNSTNNRTYNDLINLREIVIKYLRKWYWFVISAFVCFLIAFLYIKITIPTYQVQSTILLRQDESNMGFSEMAILESMGMGGTSKEVEDEIQVLKSKTIMMNVIQHLGIQTQYLQKKGFRNIDTYPEIPLELITPAGFKDTLTNAVVLKIASVSAGYKIKFEAGKVKSKFIIKNLNEAINTPLGTLKLNAGKDFDKEAEYTIQVFPIRTITESYSKSVKIAAVSKKSNAISISTIAGNVTKAKDVINKLVELYNLDAVVDKNMIASNTKKFVDERLVLIENELQNVEENVENYKKQNQLTNISSEASLFLQSSSEYNKKLAEVETQLNLISYIESHVKNSKNIYNLIPANLGIQDNSLLSLISNYNNVLLERLRLMRTTNDENPVLTQMEQQIKIVRSSIIASIASVKDGLKIAKMDILSKENQFNSKIKKVPTQERQYIEIKRQQEIKQNLYLFLLQKREENALTLASAIPTAKTLDAAYSSVIPVAPKTMIIFAITLLIAMLIPMGVIYVLDLMNNKITGKKELLRLVKAPYLGSIGINKSQDRVVVREGKTTPIVEMFRMIRTNLQFMIGGTKSPVILVTSSVGGEGKSFTAINLASSFALFNKKVVLIGLDIRKPILGDYMHIEKNKGVSLYLSDPNYKLNDIIISSGIHSSLKVIPAGPVPPNPAELLMSNRLEELISELKKEFDYIIIDSAPVGVVSDTFLINRVVDLSIYVSRQNYTPKDMIETINDIHNNQRLTNMGLVLNGVEEMAGYGYYSTKTKAHYNK